MDLDLETGTHGEVSVITARGAIDAHTAPRLRQAIIDLADEREPRIIVDLDRADVLDPTCLGVLTGGMKHVASNRGMIAVVATRAEVVRFLERSGLDVELRLSGSLDEAARRLQRAEPPTDEG